jgi:hypothetical protein
LVETVNGAMLWFHEEKGYGFILTDEGERLYVDRDGFANGIAPVGRCAKLPVELRVEERDGRRVAVDVALVQEQPTRRARRHGSSTHLA